MKQDRPAIARLWVAVLILVAIAAAGIHYRKSNAPLQLVLQMSSSTGGDGQLFIKSKGGYNEQNSLRFPLFHDGRTHTYELTLPSAFVPADVRLDPGAGKGMIRIISISFRIGNSTQTLTGSSLSSQVRPLTQLHQVSHDQPTTFRSTGIDPSLEIPVPASISSPPKVRKALGSGLLILAGVGLAMLAWRQRTALLRNANEATKRGGWQLMLLSFVSAIVLLGLMGAGCDRACSPRGLKYGGALLFAALCLCILGMATLKRLGVSAFSAGRQRLFASLLVGQAILSIYILVRSALHAAIPYLPITAPELLLLITMAALYLAAPWSPSSSWARSITASKWLAIELGLLVAICLVVADRELPRTVMLSSDPDTHAYFARKLELLRALPWSGDDVFHYPSGTAVLGFIWAKLSFLDVRNAMAALPLLQTFAAALFIGETVAFRVRAAPIALLVFLTTLGITAAGFLIPLYSNYAHMEGAGRQMAISTLALLSILLFSGTTARHRFECPQMLLAAACLLLLAILNPVNIVVPLILITIACLQIASDQRRPTFLLLAPLLLLLILPLDPYYYQLLFGSGTPESRFTVSPTLLEKPIGDIFSAWIGQLLGSPKDFLRQMAQFLPGQTSPLFGLFTVSLAALAIAMARSTLHQKILSLILAAAFVALSLWASSALFSALADDRRFYLLAPYYSLSLTQFKVVLTTLAAGGIIVLGYLRRLPFPALAAVALLVTVMVFIGMRTTQPHMLPPRATYCGSLGCAANSDLEVIRRIKDFVPLGTSILLPNARYKTKVEDWIFPVTGTRALPFASAAQPAFYYYQGSEQYTTRNYVDHVCKHLDRQWLHANGINYIFLPAEREHACLAEMESLPSTEKIIFNKGQSYLLEIR